MPTMATTSRQPEHRGASAMCRPIRQRGAALFLILLLIVIGAGIVFVSRLKSADVELDAQRKTAAALAQAKEALLGRTVSNDDPGTLPCPDINNDGIAESTVGQPGLQCPAYVGRFPWRTLGIDAVDGAAERLWYVLDPNFRDLGAAVLPTTTATLHVTGVSPVNNVAAVIIAPGVALSGQNRSLVNVNDQAQYLESYVNATTLNDPGPSATFNDILLAITAGQVHNASVNRMARELLLSYLPHPYPSGSDTSWFPTSGSWASGQRWNPWLSVANYFGTPPDNATLSFTGCPGVVFSISWNGSTLLRRTGGC